MKTFGEIVDKVLNEGIDFDPMNRVVSYNPSHEENVDTSTEHNPTFDDSIVDGVRVWSIFKRKVGLRGDGNPLVYALKGEGGWHFRTPQDEDAINRQFNIIASKFAALYPIGVTIIIPSSNDLNRRVADVVMSKSENAHLIEGFIRKLTTEEVDNIVMAEGSRFREVYGDKFNDAYYQLCDYLNIMDKEKDGTFTRHFIRDQKMRDVLDMTLTLSNDGFARFAKLINGQNILLIDDTISRGQTIKNACDIINDSYAPASITVLTLLSKLS